MRQPGSIRDIHHPVDILVGAGSLFGHPAQRRAADQNTACGQSIDHLAAPPAPGRPAPTHRPPRTVAGRAESELFCGRGPDQNIGCGAHGTADQHGLADCFQNRRQRCMPRPVCARGTLAVDKKLFFPAVDQMGFQLAGIMRHVVKDGQVGRGKDIAERLARQVGENLPVGQGAIDPGAHGAQVRAPAGRIDRGAGQFPVGQHNAMLPGSGKHRVEKLGTDLMPQPARAAMNADQDMMKMKILSILII